MTDFRRVLPSCPDHAWASVVRRPLYFEDVQLAIVRPEVVVLVTLIALEF